jgi:hypothetical protein
MPKTIELSIRYMPDLVEVLIDGEVVYSALGNDEHLREAYAIIQAAELKREGDA